jgi:retron-type reverse transcriptase
MNQLKINLFEAYYKARRNKRNSINQLKFEINYEQELFKLYEEIKNKTYKVGKSIAFIINKPVQREIFAASFRDRVVHHLIFNYINPILEPQFIQNSYSCRKGKGTLYGINQASSYLKEVSKNYTKDAYILKLDVKGYFMNINKNLLMQKLRNMISQEAFKHLIQTDTQNKIEDDIDFDTLFYLINEVIFNNPVLNCSIKGSLSDWDSLPDSKSLFKSKENCGLPIGNLTSQLFSNVYLNDFDHYVTKKLNIKYYGRYVDDFFIFTNNKPKLKSLIHHLQQHMKNNFGLQIHPKKIYLQHYTKGMAFLGAYIKPYRIYIGNRSKIQFKNKLSKITTYLQQNNVILQKKAHHIVSVTNSYLGLLSHYNTYNLRHKLLFSKPPCLLYKMGYFNSNIKKIMLYKNLKQQNNKYLLR